MEYSVQFSCSVVSDSLWPHGPQHARPPCSSPTLLKLMSIESVMPPSHLILCHPLLLLPSIPPRIRVFSNESPLHMRWPMYWRFNLNISPSNEYSGLIYFSIDWLDLFAVQGPLKSLLQHHSSSLTYISLYYFHTSTCMIIFQFKILVYFLRRHFKWHVQINTCSIHNEHNLTEVKATWTPVTKLKNVQIVTTKSW